MPTCVAAFDKVNLVAVGKVFDHGFRQITHSSKPITSPKDLAGMKIRVPASPILTSLFKGLDASPATVPIGELYTALQTKVVDGQENALPTIEATKLYEVQKYCSYTSHVWDCFTLVGQQAQLERPARGPASHWPRASSTPTPSSSGRRTRC